MTNEEKIEDLEKRLVAVENYIRQIQSSCANAPREARI